MDLLEKTISQIEPKCQSSAEKAKKHIEQLTMPYWALGRLLDLGVDLIAMTRSMKPAISRKAIFIMASDHGIADEGVSQYPKEVTLQMVYNFVRGGAGINALSRQVGARTVVVDLGVDGDLSSLVDAGKVMNAKVAYGTKNFTREPAMSRGQALQALNVGIDLATRYADEVDLFGTGEMGIANTTSSAAVASVLCEDAVENFVGRGTGIDDQKLLHKTAVINNAIRLHKPNPNDPLDVLSKIGGFEIGAIAGLILGCAAKKRPVMVDGYISTAAALMANKLCLAATDYLILSHLSAEKGHQSMCRFLGKKPLLDLEMRLGEGTGGALAMNLVEASIRILSEMATFESAGVSKEIS